VIPNRLTLVAAAWALAATAATAPQAMDERVASGALAFGLMLALALGRPSGMGMGDVKLAGVMGLYLGGAVVPALLIAFLFGSLAGAILAVRQGVALRRKTLAFGPFLALGGAVGLVAGPELVRLYGAL
jgi:leader peptidase (prepilin peptidase) / N-methyltransferase